MAKLKFGKKRRRLNYDLLREVLVWSLQIALVCFLAFVCVWYFGKRVSVIGDSMNPELKNGNVTLLSRAAYSVGAPKRGDVVAFKPNGNENSHYYVKRIIGLPGETISIEDGKIKVDGRFIKERYDTTSIEELGMLEEPITLKKSEYFVLGDDRQNSEDSRNPEIGAIKRKHIDGKVWFVLSPGKTFGFVK